MTRICLALLHHHPISSNTVTAAGTGRGDNTQHMMHITDKEIADMNKLICELEYPTWKRDVNIGKIDSDRAHIGACLYSGDYHELGYHRNMNALMRVLETITKLNPHNGKLWFEFSITRCHCRIYSNQTLDIRHNWIDTHGAVYRAVADFADWYKRINN